MNENARLKEIFFEEATDLIARIEACLLSLESEPGNKELVDNIFRSFHTIKGSGSLFDLGSINKLSHTIEDLLDDIRNGKTAISDEIINTIFKTIDLLKLLFEAEKNNKSSDELDSLTNEIISLIKVNISDSNTKKTVSKVETKKEDANSSKLAPFVKFTDIIKESITPDKKIFLIEINLNKKCLKEGLDPVILFKNLNKIGEIIVTISNEQNIPALSELNPQILYLNDMSVLYSTAHDIAEIEDIFEFAMAKGKINITEITESQINENFNNTVKTREPRLVGELLVEDGIISEEDIEKAIKNQARPIGEILVDEGKISSRQLEMALEKQQSMGVAPQVSVKVNAQKLDSLVDLVGELVISHSLVMQDQIIQGIEDQQLNSNLSQLGKVISDLQDQIMGLRMVPINHTFSRMKRLVRDTSVKLGKDVDLRIFGEDTEIDKNVIDDLNEILVHLVRNSIDHGIETPQNRKSLGKGQKGLIELNAYPKGGNIIVEVKDDGKGLSKKKIADKAKESGLNIDIDNEVLVHQLIFEPGFSTAEEVTTVSGRGVGLDVVKKKLETIRGKVEVSSEEGKGTTFTIILQPTLAIIDGMVFRVGTERMIVPTLSIEESLRPTREQVITIEGSNEAVMIRGKVYPLIRLHKVFSIDTKVTDPSDALVMLARSQGRQCVILIDELVGQQQVVIKSLGSRFKKLKVVSGGAILGDGRVGLILDLDGLMDSILEQTA